MARGAAKRIPRAVHPLCAELPLPGFPFISGENLHFFCGRRPPGDVPLHRHEQLEINILFEPAVCRVSWGRPQMTTTMTGPSIVVVSPRQWHSCCWEREAEVILLHLEPPLQRELRFARMSRGGAHPLTSSDRVLWEIASGLRRLCLGNSPAESRALALVAKSVACRAIELIGVPSVAVSAVPRLSEEDFHRVEEYTLAHLGHPIQAGDAAKCVGYQPQRLAVRVGQDVYYASISDASGIVPPKASTAAFFAVTGTPRGGRANLSVKNAFSIIVPRVERDAKLVIPE